MESLVTSPASPSTNGLATGGFPTIDPNVVVEYLASVLEITLGANRKDLESAGSLLSKPRYSETVQRCTRFATESQVALYVQKDIAAGDGLNGDIDISGICNLVNEYCYGADFRRIDHIHLQLGCGHFLLFVNDILDRTFETTASYRSFDTHLLSNTDH
jgi:dynein heavy chain 1